MNTIKRINHWLILFFRDLKRVKHEKKSWWAVVLYILKRFRRQIFYTSILIIAILVLIPPATYLWFAHDLKDKESIMNRSKTGLTLLDKDGQEFFTFNKPKAISYVPLSDIPQNMRDAVIASEDKNFYTNSGFSVRGIIRAFFTNLFAGKIVEGGSTISQELVKNAFLSSSRSFLRKYQEIVLAYELNRRYSKQDILEMYLNSVYFGEGAFGVENAAQAYFGKPAKDLTLGESALLVGLLPAPSALSPLSNDPRAALKQEKIVLQEMVETKAITQQEANDALSEKIKLNPVETSSNINTLAPHFALYVKNLLIQKYGEERIIRDGFTVKTTLDSNWQAYAEDVVNNRVQNLRGNNASNGAAVAIDPKTGEIRVMVGSYDWTDKDFGRTNMAVAPRQPGSSFKPIIYAYALEQKLVTPVTLLDDKETTFPGNYKPKDYDNRYRGQVTVRRALANSLNIPAVEVMNQVGVENGLDMAKRLGITTLKDPSQYGLSLVLGAAEVPLVEMTDAFAVFADEGQYNKPTAILEIRNKFNELVDEYKPDPKNVLGNDVAYIISSILSDNRTRAEVFGGALTISRPAAVKTGTTEDYRDALTIGYTPSLVVGVWVGNNDNTPMDNIAGSLGAAPIWRSLMEDFLAGTPRETFRKPYTVIDMQVCPSGLQTKEASQSAYTEYFISGTQPSYACTMPTTFPTPTPSQSPTPSPTQQPSPTEQPTDTPIPTPTEIPSPTPVISL